MQASVFKKAIVSIAMIMMVSFSFFPAPAKAEWTTPDFGGNSFGAVMDNLLIFIKEVIVSALKKAIVQSVSEEVSNNLSSASDGSPGWITDWREALMTEPEEVAKLQVKNFFTSMGSGRNSNYQVSGGGGTSGAGSIITNAQEVVLSTSIPTLVNLAEYGVSDTAAIFSQGDFRAFMTAYGSGGSSIGNGIEAALAGYSMKAQFVQANKDIAAAQAIAYSGFAPTTSEGQVINPGSTIKELAAKSQGLSLDALANADKIGDVVAALVTRAVSNSLHKGIGNAKDAISDKIGAENYQTFTSGTTAYGNIGQ